MPPTGGVFEGRVLQRCWPLRRLGASLHAWQWRGARHHHPDCAARLPADRSGNTAALLVVDPVHRPPYMVRNAS